VVNGNGSVTPGLSSQNLVQGRRYTVTAVPAAGMVFAGWTGSTNTLSPKISFVAASNLSFQANFIASPYVPVAGSYNGLFYQDDHVRLGQSGSLSLFVSPRGGYTGRLQVGADRYSLKGKLGLDLSCSNTVTLKSGELLIVQLEIGSSTDLNHFAGRVIHPQWVASARGNRSLYNKLNPTPLAGNYTLVFPQSTSQNGVAPDGHGYAVIKVTPTGVAVCSGKLGDGSRITQSAALSSDKTWPFFASLYSGKGAVLGWLTFADLSGTDISGPVSWIKSPDQSAKFYPLGFDAQPETAGSAYHPPVSLDQPLIPIPDVGEVDLAGGDLRYAFNNIFVFDATHKALNISMNPLTLTFSRTTGTFRGSVTDPIDHTKLPFAGVVLQKLDGGWGYATGTNLTSSVQLGVHP
jgi:hypothetical protein